mgnify:CR=1 FL=1
MVGRLFFLFFLRPARVPRGGRPSSAVLADVIDGRVTVLGAARDYGVVIQDNAVDESATEALRSRVRAARGDGLPEVVDRGQLLFQTESDGG